MRDNRVLRRLIPLAISAGVALAMVAMFTIVGGLGPGADDDVALAAGPGNGKNKTKNLTAACAQTTGPNTRPGWGHGDRNHVHTGPPGLCRKLATTTTGTRTTTTGTLTTGTLTTGTLTTGTVTIPAP